MELLIIIGFTFTILVCAIIIIIVVIQKLKRGELTEFSSTDQFSSRSYRPGEGFSDEKQEKIGKVHNFHSSFSRGFISWNDFFFPDTEEKRKMQKIACLGLLFVYVLLLGLVLIFSFSGMLFGVLFLLILLIYLTILLLFKFIKIRVFKKFDL